MTTFTISGAYGRDYTSLGAALEAFNDGRDFFVHSVDGKPAGTYFSARDTKPGDTIHLRYRNMQRVALFTITEMNGESHALARK